MTQTLRRLTDNRMRRIQHIHFVGIGGSGMGGIAEVLINLGYDVRGSDLKPNAVTERLQGLGAKIAFGHAGENLGDADVVVVSSAVKPDNPEVQAALARRLPVVQRADVRFTDVAAAMGVDFRWKTVKKTPLDDFSNPRKAGIIAVGLDEGDYLIGAALTDGRHDVMLFSDGGKAVRFHEAPEEGGAIAPSLRGKVFPPAAR